MRYAPCQRFHFTHIQRRSAGGNSNDIPKQAPVHPVPDDFNELKYALESDVAKEVKARQAKPFNTLTAPAPTEKITGSKPNENSRNNRGPKPKKTTEIRSKILDALKSGEITVDSLLSEKQENLASQYSASREIVVSRFRVKAICAVCSTSINKAQGIRNLHKIQNCFHIQQMEGQHIIERIDHIVNSDMEAHT